MPLKSGYLHPLYGKSTEGVVSMSLVDKATPTSAGVVGQPFYVPRNMAGMSIVHVHGFPTVAGVGTDPLLIDILLNGVTIFDTVEAAHRRLRVNATEIDSVETDAADEYVLDPTNVLLAEGDIITANINQLADGTAHDGLTVNLEASI